MTMQGAACQPAAAGCIYGVRSPIHFGSSSTCGAASGSAPPFLVVRTVSSADLTIWRKRRGHTAPPVHRPLGRPRYRDTDQHAGGERVEGRQAEALYREEHDTEARRRTPRDPRADRRGSIRVAWPLRECCNRSVAGCGCLRRFRASRSGQTARPPECAIGLNVAARKRDRRLAPRAVSGRSRRGGGPRRGTGEPRRSSTRRAGSARSRVSRSERSTRGGRATRPRARVGGAAALRAARTVRMERRRGVDRRPSASRGRAGPSRRGTASAPAARRAATSCSTTAAARRHVMRRAQPRQRGVVRARWHSAIRDRARPAGHPMLAAAPRDSGDAVRPTARGIDNDLHRVERAPPECGGGAPPARGSARPRFAPAV
jgi:hypothetical protein